MGRYHSHELTGWGDEGSRLHRSHAGTKQDLLRTLSHEDRVSRHIFDDHLPPGAQGGTARCAGAVYLAEEIEEFGAEPSLRDDL
jgi:hypothetical protein